MPSHCIEGSKSKLGPAKRQLLLRVGGEGDGWKRYGSLGLLKHRNRPPRNINQAGGDGEKIVGPEQVTAVPFFTGRVRTKPTGRKVSQWKNASVSKGNQNKKGNLFVKEIDCEKGENRKNVGDGGGKLD